jgi:hypothetical protein
MAKDLDLDFQAGKSKRPPAVASLLWALREKAGEKLKKKQKTS